MAGRAQPTKPQPKAPETRALALKDLVPVTFVESQNQATLAVDHDLTGDGFVEAPSNLAPTAQWSKPGEFVEGIFLGLADEVGPNESRLYNFKMEDGALVAVWGGTVLDSRMDMCRAQGLDVGDTVRIVYVGDAQAKKGQNPARIFKVGFKPKGQ